MKKRILSLLLVIGLTLGLLPLSVQTASAATEEKAWYPAARMYIVQIAYESGTGASHSDRNTFDIDTTTDIKSKKERRAFAPFTGIVVYKESEYNFVLLQSKNKVRYADGTLDYMCVGFMHDSNISNLKLGQEIKQGTAFYDVGNRNKNKFDANMDEHIQVTVYKGRLYDVNKRNKNGTYKKLHDFSGRWYSEGTVDPYNAFFVNTSKTKTTKYTEVGHLGSGHKLSNADADADWSGRWKDLKGNPFPKLPTISERNAPGNLKVGQNFNVTGVVNSKTRLLSVTAGVYSTGKDGKMLTGKKVDVSKPYYNGNRKLSYKITGNSLAKSIKFNKLSPGTYYYRVYAKNGGGTKLLINQKFTVQGNKPENTNTDSTEPKTDKDKDIDKNKENEKKQEQEVVYLSGENYPVTLKVGDRFQIKGTISANVPLKSVTVEVYADNGTCTKIGGTMTINDSRKSFELSYITTDQMKFQYLSAGTYWYKVIAKVSSGEKMLLNRKFTVEKPVVTPTYVYPTPAWYTLAPACAPDMRLDVAYSGVSSEDKVWTWLANGSNAQFWYLKPYSQNVEHYLIIPGVDVNSNMVLDVQYGGIDSGTPVWQYEFNGTPAQQWLFMDAGGGYYYIVPSENQKLTLAVKGGSSAEGSDIIVETRNGSLGQKWKLIKY